MGKGDIRYQYTDFRFYRKKVLGLDYLNYKTFNKTRKSWELGTRYSNKKV